KGRSGREVSGVATYRDGVPLCCCHYPRSWILGRVEDISVRMKSARIRDSQESVRTRGEWARRVEQQWMDRSRPKRTGQPYTSGSRGFCGQVETRTELPTGRRGQRRSTRPA